MPTLLYIQASPRGMDSFSTLVAESFLDAFRSVHRDYGVDRLDLFHADLPPFEAPQAAAKYAVLSGQTPAGPAARAWKAVIDVINHFKSADMYLISSPMWNFSIPYRLKQYIDILVQPALTFSYSADKGYQGLVTGRKAVLALARGGSYPATGQGAAFDMQKAYLELVLGFIGLTDIRSIIVEPTLGSPAEQARQILEAAQAKARSLASEL